MSWLSYSGSKLAPICTVLVGLSMTIFTALVSSPILKMPGVWGIPGLSGVTGKWRLSSLRTAAVTVAVPNSSLLYSQYTACHALASTVMTPIGPRILSLRYA
jgi:hypothetical protein